MNDSKAEGFFDEVKGKVKQAVGNTFGDQKMANSGATDEVKGHAEQTWGNVKDTASNIGSSHTAGTTEVHADNAGRDARNSVTSGAENLKDSVKRGLDHLENKVRD